MCSQNIFGVFDRGVISVGLNVDWEILLQYQPIGIRVGMYVTIQQSKLVHILISSVLVMFMLLNYYD